MRLIASGEMRAAGYREVERAREDGRWDAAYAPQSEIEVPQDLAEALRKNGKAAAEFGKLDSRNRYAVLHRLESAKKAETRERRLARFVAMLENGERIY